VSAYSGGSGHDIFGNAIDTAPVDAEFRGLFPPGSVGVAAGEHQQMPKRTEAVDGPKRGQKKRRRKKVPQPTTPEPYKVSKSAPGGQVQPSRTRKQQGG
jgi:hypothetical protein